mmetsp:Transcript_27454/g.32199  ORF Transcript_27454/g.32199 Transcript_27454/m.32199 type:complete len:219 (+) Transcript_27454:87-743(+)
MNKIGHYFAVATLTLASLALAEQEMSLDAASDVMERELRAAGVAASKFTAPTFDPWSDYRMAICEMQFNPAYPTTNPNGYFWLYEYGPWSPLYIDGYMNSMPGPDSLHGLEINTNSFDGRDCASTEPHWNPLSAPHGNLNSWPSMAGDLGSIADFSGYSSWTGYAWQPTLYGSWSVQSRSMCVYESHGPTPASYGRQIACCDIEELSQSTCEQKFCKS